MVCVGLGVFSEPTALRADISWPAAASWWGRLSPGHRPGSSVLTVELVLGSDCAHLLASGTPPTSCPILLSLCPCELGVLTSWGELAAIGVGGVSTGGYRVSAMQTMSQRGSSPLGRIV